MSTIDKKLEEIFFRVTAQTVSLGNDPPGLLSTGDGTSVFVNRIIENHIRDIADVLYENDADAQKTHTPKGWQATVRSAIGRSLFSTSRDIDRSKFDAREHKKIMKKEIEKLISEFGELKSAYGCWLFVPVPRDAIMIGPVHFQRKDIWLDKALKDGIISKSAKIRLSREAVGSCLEKKKTSNDGHFENALRHQISDSPTICEVRTYGLAPELAYTRCKLAANLALASISLIWKFPSRTLGHFQIIPNGRPQLTSEFLFSSENRKVQSWRAAAPHVGFHVDSGRWEALYQDAQSYLVIAGEMIECWTNIDRYNNSSPLLRSLSQSLLIFWRACCEEIDILSVVLFVAVMETLATGQGQSGIIGLIKARLGFNDDQPIIQGKTVKQVVEKIYGDARSRTVHGTFDELLEDWSEVRTMSEVLARDCLVSSMVLAQSNWEGKDLNYLFSE